jgi:hypothetical protein
MVMSQPAEKPGFASLPLSEQITAVLPDARANGAMAVVWMSFPLSKQVMLHLVALGSGRAFVRTIETDRSSVSESSLALIARELLGTAYLFESPAELPEEVGKVVRGVKQQIPPEPAAVVAPAAPTLEAPRPWELWVDSAMRYPLAGGSDALPVLRFGAALGRQLPAGFNGSLGLTAGYARVARPATRDAQFVLAGATAALYRGFPVYGLSVGPKVAASLDLGTFLTQTQTLRFGLPSVALGAQARTEAPGAVAVSVGVFATWSPVGAELQAPDSSVLYRTPALELNLALAVGWEGL